MTETLVSFSVDLPQAAGVDPLDTVGRIYEVGLNGQGFMLFDGKEAQPELQRRRQVVPLDPPRLAVSDTPFSEAVERYSFAAYSDWRGGAGQRVADRAESVPNRYLASEGVDPFDFGRIRLLRATVQQVATSHTAVRAVIADDELYAQTGTAQLKQLTAPGGSPSAGFGPADGTISSLATDGQYWYAAVLGGATPGIFRNDTNAWPAIWSTIAPDIIDWGAQRILAAVKAGGSATPNRFTTLTGAGAEEVVNGHLTLDNGWTITDFAAGGGHVWFSAHSDSRGVIYAWPLTGAPRVAWELPIGQRATAVHRTTQGQLYVRAEHLTAAGESRATIYQALTDTDGNVVQAAIVAELTDASTVHGPGTFAEAGKLVLFSWTNQNAAGNDGLGAIDVSTGGYAKWLKGPVGASAEVRSITFWRGRVVFTVDGQGVYSEDMTEYEPTGFVLLSLWDFASSTDKVWDRVTAWMDPLPANTSVTLESSVDGGGSYQSITGGTAATVAQKSLSAELAVSSRSLGLKVQLGTTDGNSTPAVSLVQVQAHPLGKADLVLQLPIDCGDNVAGLNGALLLENGPGNGVRRARALEVLAQTEVLVQDVDWPIVQIAETFEVISVDRIPLPAAVRESPTGVANVHEVAVLTLRRSFK